MDDSNPLASYLQQFFGDVVPLFRDLPVATLVDLLRQRRALADVGAGEAPLGVAVADAVALEGAAARVRALEVEDQRSAVVAVTEPRDLAVGAHPAVGE